MAELDVTSEMRQKIEDAGDYPILDSEFIPFALDPDGPKVEKTHGTRGYYISSPVDGFVLHGPFGEAGA